MSFLSSQNPAKLSSYHIPLSPPSNSTLADQGIQNRGGRKATDPNDLIKSALQDGLTEEKSEICGKRERVDIIIERGWPGTGA